MNTSILLAYLMIIVGVAAWAVMLFLRWQMPQKVVQGLSVFGGAFLLGSCFINLVPHIFLGEGGGSFVVGGVKIAATVLVGFVVQMLLGLLTRGVEHSHGPAAAEVNILGLMIGLSLHAFLEGMPLVDIDGELHQGLLYGIVLHNIPIALVLLSLFTAQGYGRWRIVALLLLFGVMTPIGSLFNLLLLPQNEVLQRVLMGIVVGILLHVSVSILFDHDDHKVSLSNCLLIIIAFVAAYFTPGCPEIYPVF